MKRIDKYEGLYGERAPKPETGYLYSELLCTRSREYDWYIEPHVHPALYQLFFVEIGHFTFFEADRQRRLAAPCLILIPPMALHGFDYESKADGHILTLSDVMVDTLFPGETLTPMLTGIRCFNDFSGPYAATAIQALMQAVGRELFNDQPEKQLMLRACLQQLFLAVYRMWQYSQQTATQSDNHSLGYFRKFQQRIREAGTTQSIAALAKELGITPVHLNRICKEVAGRSAGQLVQDHLLEEAKKYLRYTSYSISEIAYLLNFEYPNYFARFFRKHTGMTPGAFREHQA